MPKTGQRVGRPKSILVLHLKTDGSATFKSVPHTLGHLQELVGGYLEPIRLMNALAGRNILGLVNEEGLGKLPPNPFSASLLRDNYGLRLIVGDAVVLREKESDFDSLNERDQELLRTMLSRQGVTAAPWQDGKE